ncbi:hypothetical protein MP228_008624 [Amoeboaphelidium protococcarum]|nr:hypothetical protein MP228_008624 [Amoeboaphelidium protococcarum]
MEDAHKLLHVIRSGQRITRKSSSIVQLARRRERCGFEILNTADVLHLYDKIRNDRRLITYVLSGFSPLMFNEELEFNSKGHQCPCGVKHRTIYHVLCNCLLFEGFNWTESRYRESRQHVPTLELMIMNLREGQIFEISSQ